MKYRWRNRTLCLIILGLLAGCSAPPQPVKPEAVILRLADTMPEEHPSAQTMTYFSRLVAEKTEGRVEIKVYYDSSQGTAKEIIEQVKFGGIAMARVNSLELTQEVENIRKYFEPGNFKSGELQMEWIDSNEERLRDECQMERITPLVWYYPDLRCFYGRDITFFGKEQLAGKRIESNESPLLISALEDLGAEVIRSVNTDTQKSLIAGNIDGVESSLGEFICRNYNQYTKTVTINPAWYFPDVIIINTANLTSLSKEDRELLELCARETYEYQKEQMEHFQQEWIQKLSKSAEIYYYEGDFK